MITFKYKSCDELISARKEDKCVIHKCNPITLSELLSEVELFVLSLGYVLPKGARIGYEYDDEPCPTPDQCCGKCKKEKD